MIRIRGIHGDAFLLSRDRLEQVQDIFRQAFPEMAGYADRIPSLLRDPIHYGYRSALLVAESAVAQIDAFALVLHFPGVECCFLDFIAARQGVRAQGYGGALYEAAREYCQRLNVKGLYMEVQPDTPELTPDPEILKQSKRRIQFYERYGVRAIEGTDYATPVGDPTTVAFLLFDGLGRSDSLSRKEARQAVEMILTRRFGHVANPEYVHRVVESFRDDPVKFRPLQYVKPNRVLETVESRRLDHAYGLVITPNHEIHHVKERGYFERPVRVEAIKEGIGASGLFTTVKTVEHGEKAIRAVHDSDFIHYMRTVCSKLKEGRPVYPDTFPVRKPDRRPKQLPVQAGYYCIDTGTPLYRNAYVAARSSADTALTAADEILAGRKLAYGVCRPPGHHAGRRFYGGFCYFNNAAIAAQYLIPQARTAILDVDFHHGNGTQDIFYSRSDVLTISIHGHPDYSYPYFSGYEYETGSGEGIGFNRNFPLPPQTDDEKYLKTYNRVMELLEQSRAEIIILGLGFDILKGDPTGTFTLRAETLRTMGARIMKIGPPVLVIQEGGYNLRNIRRGCAEFFAGCAQG
jgi:acetoin utilization deacetylase AcuC-like enzyme/GNAT superfamily N-acetyltransferase